MFFERVALQCKNFDMAIIFRDFHTFKRINSIPRESIDTIKHYLNNENLVYSEGLLALNWHTVLASIRGDFEAFLDGGAWKFLQDDAEGISGQDNESDEAESDFDDDS